MFIKIKEDMMQIRKKDNNNFYLTINDEDAKVSLFRIFACNQSLVQRIDINNWLISKNLLPLLEDFDLELITMPWENIGQGLKYEPYEYQKETVLFGCNQDNALFCLPCGAGKSFIAITLYHELILSNKINTAGIIVVPASLKYQWVKEVSKFSDYIAHAIDTPSKAKKKFDAQFENCDLLICNYETLKNKQVAEKIIDMNLDFMFIDEIHGISNYKSGKSKAIYQFSDIPYKYGATATPIVNNPEGLFGMFNFIDPDLFKSHGKFASNYLIYRSYGIVSGAKNVDHLKQQIRPYIFMKTEEEVASQLPELVITPIYCQMDGKIAKINDDIMRDLKIAKDAVEAIEKKITNPKLLETNAEYLQWKAKVLAYQTFAQELADDPRLLSMSESNMTNQYKVDGLKSAKLDTLVDLVEEILDAGETVCIFTRYERMKRLIVQELSNKFKGVNIAQVDGSMSAQERYDQAYDKFQDDDSYRILVMTNAGSTGISLSKCKNLIEYDLADSYAETTQRHGRIKRADSISRISNVYQLLLEGSYDDIALRIINKKQKYDNDIIQSLRE
jgi:SNF2 family DNA or RNA helicase